MGVIKAGRMRRAKVVAFVGAMRNLYISLVGKPEGERPFGRPTGKCEDNVKVDVTKWDGMVWTVLIWLKIMTRAYHVNMGMKLRV